MRKRTWQPVLVAMLVLAVILSVSGGTLAWFTDSVTSGGNIIKSGELDVDMKWANGKEDPIADATVWNDAADENVAVFNYDLWEPGYAQVRHVKIANIGSLALKYELKIEPDGEVSKLADVIDVLYFDENSAKAVTSRADLNDAVNLGTLADFIKLNEDNTENTAKGHLKAGENHTVTLALKMQESAGNEYQGLSIGSGFKLVLYATQDTVETDSFDNQYDAGAAYPEEDNKIYSVEELEKKYTFSYFDSMSDAINAVNAGNGMDGSETRDDDTYAGVYVDEAGEICVVLLKDEQVAKRLVPEVDMKLNLGGNVLSANESVCINVMGGNLTIDGRLEGSAIIQNSTFAGAGCVQIPASSTAETVTITGGTYGAYNQSGGVACALNLKSTTCVTTITDCDISASTTNKTNSKAADGIVNDGIAIVTNCNIRAYSDYHQDETGTKFTAVSYGVYNLGSLTMTDCDVFGVHSGIGSFGSLDITGGTLSGYGHGGMYISGEGQTVYVRNAVLKDCLTMPEGYTATAPHNASGGYVGGTSANNIKVYMDNCDLYGLYYPFVLRGSSGETDNSVYISNSRVNTDAEIRIDSDALRLYIGAGNNFTAEHTSRPEAVIVTNEIYQ